MRPRSVIVGVALALIVSACSGSAADTASAPASTASDPSETANASTGGDSGGEIPLLDDGAQAGASPGGATTSDDGTESQPTDDGETTSASTPETTVPAPPTTAAAGTPTTQADSTPTTAPTTQAPVIDDRAPTTTPDSDLPEENTVRNGDGNIVTLDQAGALACAAAENVLTAVDEGTDPASPLLTLLEWSSQTERPAIPAAVDELPAADQVGFDEILPVLEVCIDEGYEL